MDALKRVVTEAPDVHLSIVGVGPYEGRLSDMVKELGLASYVTFVGRVPFSSMPSVYAEADLVVVPSVFEEPLGRTVLEAMAMGKPVVASSVGAMPELIEHGVSGWLFPSGDSAALSSALLIPLADPALRDAIGLRARQRSVQKFGDSHSVSRVIEVYHSVVEGGPVAQG